MRIVPVLLALPLLLGACAIDPFDSCVPGESGSVDLAGQCCLPRGVVGGAAPLADSQPPVADGGTSAKDLVDFEVSSGEDESEVEVQSRRWYGRGSRAYDGFYGYRGFSYSRPTWRPGFAPPSGWVRSGSTFVWTGPPGAIYICPSGYAFVQTGP